LVTRLFLVQKSLGSRPSETTKIKVMKQQLPDAKKHQQISFLKSAIRIVGYAFIPYSLETATILLIFSEFVGIIEELV
jgi:hypothetical protein